MRAWLVDEVGQLQRSIQALAASWSEALKAGNHRKANSKNAAISKVARRLRKDKRLSESVLGPLLGDADPSVRLMASVHSLDLGIRLQQAEQVLEEIANNPNIPVIRLMARIGLANWRKSEGKASLVSDKGSG